MTAHQKTVGDACDSWLRTCERNGLERSTMKAYRSHAKIHIEPKIRDLLVSDLGRGDIRDFMDELLDDGVSRPLVKKIMVSLRAILAEAVEREWIGHNVAAEIKVKRSNGRDKKRIIIPTKDEIRTIVAQAPESHRVMFMMSIFTGMRISELRGLCWSAVDLDQKIIRVVQRADEYGVLGSPKSRAGQREIPMAPIVLAALKGWTSKTGSARPAGAVDLVFPNSAGRVQNYANIYNRVFKPMLVENGIVDGNGQAKFGIHSLRHAAASLFIEQGWNPKKIQTLLGHASINMTMDVYGHLFESLEEDVVMFEKLEKDLLIAC